MTPDPRFPDAPADAYVTPEGWLVIDQEAWTVEEWARRNQWEVEFFRKRRPEEAT